MYNSILNTSTFKQVNPVYSDPTVTVNSRPFYTEQGMHMTLPNMLSGANDVKINNFSNLYLTNRKKLGDVLSVRGLPKVQRAFTSFLTFDSIKEINSDSLYWLFNTNLIGENPRVCLVEHIYPTLPVNENFFEIVFLDDMFCEIHHNDQNTDYLLTLDYSFNLSFAPRFDLAYINGQSYHPQTFYYIYDEVNDYIVFYKTILDFPYYMTYSNLGRLGLKQPPLGSTNTFPLDSIIKLRHADTPYDSYDLEEFNVRYSKTTSINTLDTSEINSRNNIQNNYLVNTEYSNITGSDVKVNILTLKNELSPQNNNADNDTYIGADDFTYRDYKKIFSGTNQVKGSDSIILSYTGFTSKIELEPNTITYFHVPANTFPYSKINVNDTNFTSKGAAASDHPLKSDKIFKKRADYSNYSYSGNSSDENSGTFLCAWLSGNGTSETTPVWVDRYYNPQQISFFDALSATNSIAQTYTTEFDTLQSIISTGSIVFDTISNLYIEKGVYYAYHHIGGTDLSNYVNLLSSSLIQNNLVNYFVNNTQLLTNTNQLLEYQFNGQEYSQTITLDEIYNNSNCFTLTFDINVSDWRSDFAYELVGNYTDSGFGIFNQTNITPYYMIPQRNTIVILNSDFKIVDKVTFEADVVGIFRKEELKGYYTLLSNGRLYNLAANHVIISKSQTNIPSFDNVTGTFYNNNSAAILVNSVSSNQLYCFDFTTESIYTPASSNIISLNSLPLSAANSCTIYNDVFYCTSSYITRLYEGSIYYLKSDTEIRKWDITSGGSGTDLPFISAFTPIDSFNIDIDGNFSIVQDNKLSKYTSTRQLVLTAALYNPDFRNVDIDFAGDFTPEGYRYNTIVTQFAATSGGIGTNLIKYDSDGKFISNVNIPSLNSPIHTFNVSNGNFIAREIYPYLTSNSLTVRASLPNLLGRNSTTVAITQSLSAVDSGTHNIAVRFDNVQGQLALFIDGLNVGTSNFEPGEYARSAGLTVPFTIGASPFFNNALLSQYLKGLYFYVLNTKISDLRIYTKPLLDSDISAIANKKYTGTTMLINLPAGKRNLNDEIERFFKLDVPSLKSLNLNISMVNSGIQSDKLKKLLVSKILSSANNVLPSTVAVNTIDWID